MTEIAEVEAKRKVTLNLEVSLAQLKAAAADVRLACLRKDEGGCLYRTSPGEDVTTVIDPDHVYHNFTTKLLWSSKKQLKSRRVLDLEIIRKAAKKTGDEMPIATVYNAYGKHSHAHQNAAGLEAPSRGDDSPVYWLVLGGRDIEIQIELATGPVAWSNNYLQK